MLQGITSNRQYLPPIPVKYHRFKGVNTAYKILLNFDRAKPVLVYFDPDIDGLISGFFVCRFLTKLGFSFSWYINENREHGFKIPLTSLKGINIVAVDFFMSPNEVKEIVDSGSNIISMDHHENGNKLIKYRGTNGKRGVVINNQYAFEEEDSRYLSGAGVVFEVLRLFDPEFDTIENRALVGLTLLSDIRNIENRNARGYLTDLYQHKYRGYIKYLIDGTIGDKDYTFGIPRLDRNYVEYKLSPAINAALRYNKGYEVVEFILGRGKLDLKYHNMQKEFLKKLINLANVSDRDSVRFIEVDCRLLSDYENSVASNFIGLVASGYLDDRSCISYLKLRNGKIGRSSFRGAINGLDYLSPLLNYNLLSGVGHPYAFGILDIDISDKNKDNINACIQRTEKGVQNTESSILNVRNLSMFVTTMAKDVAIENMFCLSNHRKYVKYVGKNIIKKRNGAKYTEYAIDGHSVMCFEDGVTPENGLILTTMERGVVYFYLRSSKGL